jgi:hypothetical protein
LAATDRTFHTVTMARMLVQQGELARAADIYRYLLRGSPERDDLAQALARIEDELAAKDPYDLVTPLTEWAALTLEAGMLARLQTLRRCLRQRRGPLTGPARDDPPQAAGAGPWGDPDKEQG